MSDKTNNEIVMDALTTVLTDMWYDNNPYCDPQDYAIDFQRFCEKRFNFMMANQNN